MAERQRPIHSGQNSTIALRTDTGAETTCRLANTFRRRFVGLMGRSGLPAGTGILFVPGGSIHTAFMRFPIDAIFIDATGTVAAVTADIRPWRLASGHGARFTMELEAGQAKSLGIRTGARLQLMGNASSTWSNLGCRRGRLWLHKTAAKGHAE